MQLLIKMSKEVSANWQEKAVSLQPTTEYGENIDCMPHIFAIHYNGPGDVFKIAPSPSYLSPYS